MLKLKLCLYKLARLFLFGNMYVIGGCVKRAPLQGLRNWQAGTGGEGGEGRPCPSQCGDSVRVNQLLTAFKKSAGGSTYNCDEVSQ